MRRNGNAPRLASTRRAAWRYAIFGLGWMLPLANVHAAAGSHDDEPATATLEVRALDSAQVHIDGTTHDGGSVEVRVPAGDHRVQVTAAGYHPWGVTVRLRPGSHVTMTTDLLATDTSAHPPRLAAMPQVQKPDVLLKPRQPPQPKQSKQPGVFLNPPRAPELMLPPTPAGSTALMPTHSASPQALMPTRSVSPPATAEVFMATPARGTFLPTQRSSHSDLFMTEPRPPGPNVFMSTD